MNLEHLKRFLSQTYDIFKDKAHIGPLKIKPEVFGIDEWKHKVN